MIGKVSGTRVLGTSARKPPLSDTLLWATLSLAHPFKIEVILSKRVDVLPKQRGCEAQNIVVDHLAFSAELADYIPDVQRIPSNDRRPKKLSPKELKTIRTLLRSNEVPVQDIAAQFKVNRSTLYRNVTAVP